MNKYNQRKENFDNSTRHSLDESYEGTAARTRPLSFNEVMLRRKSKKVCENVKDGAVKEGNLSRKDIPENISSPSAHERSNNYSRDGIFGDLKSIPDNVRRTGSQKKEEEMPRKEEDRSKSRKRESRDLETKSKHKMERDKILKFETGGRGHGRSKIDELLRDNSEHDYEKKHYKDRIANDRYMDRNRGTSEQEHKRKDRNEVAEKYREKNAMKKHHTGRRNDSEISVRKEKIESSYSLHGEARLKRAQLRGRENVEGRDGRSNSSLSREHKYVSSHVHEQGDLNLYSHNDRSGRYHSDAGKSRISSNGSIIHNRKHGESSSGLGGYSPRKRKTEAAVKTPPPPERSPEKKSATWDFPSAGSDTVPMGSNLSGSQLILQTKSSNVVESRVVPVASDAVKVKPFSGLVANAVTTNKNATIDSIQLTQSTRPMRRLYVDNVPGSASEKDIMECFNYFLLSSGVNHIQGTQPCISCMIHKDKGQALVEFLTPEDASAALTFDGSSFSGCVLRIRRPKDFSEAASDSVQKSKAEAHSVSDLVKDSSHKIFIGGISEAITSQMLMEIASVFGQLKSYHFQVNEDLNEPCAFLEYADQSVTLKACAGLNGMKLGGRLITVAQADPNASSVDESGSAPSYDIPEHVKPLLAKPTQILLIKNVLNGEAIDLLSEAELEEILEDVRLECVRFGSVKSIRVVKTICAAIPEPHEVRDNTGSPQTLQDRAHNEQNFPVESAEAIDHADESAVHSETEAMLEPADEFESDLTNTSQAAEAVAGADEAEENSKAYGALEARESGMIGGLAVEGEVHTDDFDVTSQEVPNQESEFGGGSAVSSLAIEDTNCQANVGIKNTTPNAVGASDLDEDNWKMQEDVKLEMADTGEKGENNEDASDLACSFEAGSVLVEFRRAEASCMAAHCLHGRLFDDRVVTVEYVPCNLFEARFPK
ncbi:hypothetical protein Nepgr_031021 [Nepenthes gracilis]|uniref:RRM domain-containing protein n=1 Tax=Nepenthes gracilis TaxID=150966 RepID=A0AAD3TFU6_NEPGR|nr:hypothetical protein Nepgr_031021 [Nepenthes gracilis]